MKKIFFVLVLAMLTLGCVSQTTNNTQQNQTNNQQPPTLGSGISINSSGEPIQIPPQGSPMPPSHKDNGAVGSMNHYYLQDAPFSSIMIEIDYVQGYEPTEATKDALVNFFRTYANKEVVFSGGNLIVSSKTSYTVNDLIELEGSNRRHYSVGDTAVIYMLFVNGQFENPGALGVAYKASSAALFVENINDATTALILYSQIEKAVALHEVGHLMGLVNINYNSEKPHHDASHSGHSNNENSVMYWAVEDISLKNVLNLGPPDQFDSDDAFDLQKIRDGTY